MTGTEVRNLRLSLGLEPAQFAQLIAVHSSSLYRWEAAGAQEIHVEPFQFQLLSVLGQQVAARRSEAERRQLAETLLGGLVVGGGLFALFKLLQAVFNDGPAPRRTGGAVTQPTGGRARRSPQRGRRSS